MAILEPIILGIIQGITEWLPISSSGHLVLAQELFGLKQTVTFDLALHVGSLLVVLFVFRNEISELIKGVFRGKKDKLMLLLYIALATIPTAAIGYFFKDWLEGLFYNLYFVGYGFIFSAFLLYLSKYPAKKEKKLTSLKAFIIGIFQGISIIPSVSRSGSTISAGMIMGIKREDVAKFSFLIFIPAILGAAILQLPEVSQVTDVSGMIVGTVVAMVVGFLSLKLLLSIIRHGKFHLFAYYCLAIGIVSLLIAYI